jgi:hypothetical protein
LIKDADESDESDIVKSIQILLDSGMQITLEIKLIDFYDNKEQNHQLLY